MMASVSTDNVSKRQATEPAVRVGHVLWIAPGPGESADQEWGAALAGIEVTCVTGLADASAAILQNRFDCALVTGSSEDIAHVDLLAALKHIEAVLPVIFWDRDVSVAQAVLLSRCAAHHVFGYADSPDALLDCLNSAIEDRRCREKARIRPATSTEAWRSLLVGESRAMESVAETIRLVGLRRCTVLISGESGTGKEMAARALHMASPRANQPMVAINCTTLPENLLEAELFGHTKGAFTGAANARVGRFEQANKGTLFLDEIGDLPLELQPKLLRVLQEREIQRLGSSDTIKVDVRVIAATNVDLLERVRQGRFREDLYYRLNVVPLHMPSLRDRESDVPLLMHHFIRKVCQFEGIPVKQLAPGCMQNLPACQWPGNVRQLENAVEMAVAMSGDREMLYPADFGMGTSTRNKVVSINLSRANQGITQGADFGTAVNQFERQMIEEAIDKAGGNKTRAAAMLGMKRTTLIMKLRNFESTSLRLAV